MKAHLFDIQYIFFYEIHKIINDLVNRDMVNPEHESFIFDREIVGSGHIHDSIKNYLNVF